MTRVAFCVLLITHMNDRSTYWDLKVTTAHCFNKMCDLLHHDYRNDVLAV